AVGAGRLWCWGANQAGQLGTGNDDPQFLPTVVPLAAVRDVAAGGHHTCAGDASGTAWCWGANPAGQLGEGTTSSINVPVPVTGVENSAGVAAGDAFSCARRGDGTVWCWGDDRLGQLGIGSDVEQLSPVRVSLERALAITAGGAQTCALRPATDGASTTVCWGDNQAGQVGDGTRLDRAAPVSLKISLGARGVAAGDRHTCLRGGDGSVWCWGRGGSGQLGTQAFIDVAVPVTVAGLTGTADISAGGAHTCALKAGVASCWGGNEQGQLGDGSTDGRSTPGAIGGTGDIAQIAAGGEHTCARQTDGKVACWGRGLEGQLGQNAFDNSATPVPVANLAGETGARLANVIKLAAGRRHTCAVLSGGRVACWGDGAAGQLGWRSMASATNRRQIPVAVVGLGGPAVDVATGTRHSCARTTPDGNPETPGSVYCWGANDAGQLGNGGHDTWWEAMTPVPVAGVLAIAAGGAHTCALASDQSVFCWGSNSSGQLGDGATLQYLTPQPTQVSCP
ncbi:MAG: RCC1 repeat-containing protein, partial [Verrucomicrobiota bacterium]